MLVPTKRINLDDSKEDRFDVGGVKGTDKFVERLNQARAIAAVKEEENDDYCGNGKRWKNELTVPRAPNLSQRGQPSGQNFTGPMDSLFGGGSRFDGIRSLNKVSYAHLKVSQLKLQICLNQWETK